MLYFIDLSSPNVLLIFFSCVLLFYVFRNFMNFVILLTLLISSALNFVYQIYVIVIWYLFFLEQFAYLLWIFLRKYVWKSRLCFLLFFCLQNYVVSHVSLWQATLVFLSHSVELFLKPDDLASNIINTDSLSKFLLLLRRYMFLNTSPRS